MSVTAEPNQAVDMMAIQAIDRVVQSGPRINSAIDRQRVVDVLRPALFFKHLQNRLLIGRRNTKPFDSGRCQFQFSPVRIPAGTCRDSVLTVVRPESCVCGQCDDVMTDDGDRSIPCRSRHSNAGRGQNQAGSYVEY